RYYVESFPTDEELRAMEPQSLGSAGKKGASGTATSITARELSKQIEAGAAVAIDLRDARTFGRSRIPKARNLPAEDMPSRRVERAEIGGRLVLYDRSGDGAKELAQRLSSEGTSVSYLEGGVLAWEGEGLGIE